MKLLTIIGARPQFVKSAVVSSAIEEFNRDEGMISETLLHTGQHFDSNMSEIFFEQLGIRNPDINLGVSGGSQADMTARMVKGIGDAYELYKPDLMLLYGDTNSTISGAIVASKLGIPIAHVEAGLRSHNITMPEEVNRIVTDRLSTALYCPSQRAVENLVSEGVEFWSQKPQYSLVGDVMFDCMLKFEPQARPPVEIEYNNEGFVLCTIHRAENTNNENLLVEILSALNEIGAHREVIMPIHPRTLKILNGLADGKEFNNIRYIEPVGYLEMIWLLKNASLVVTDSGGLQKEAYYIATPCVTLRDETEWVELLDAGGNVLCPPILGREEIVKSVEKMEKIKVTTTEVYGHGDAAQKIVASLAKM